MLPGDSLTKKSAYATLGGGLTAFLVSQGIYIPNEETLILVAFLIMARLAYVKLASPIGSMLQDYITELQAKMSSSAKQELAELERAIANMEEYKDNPEVVAAYFETCRENIVMEAELTEVQQRLTFLGSVKAKLDERVRRENERLAAERKAKQEALMKALLEELKKPKVQEAILKKCIADLGKLPAQQQSSAL